MEIFSLLLGAGNVEERRRERRTVRGFLKTVLTAVLRASTGSCSRWAFVVEAVPQAPHARACLHQRGDPEVCLVILSGKRDWERRLYCWYHASRASAHASVETVCVDHVMDELFLVVATLSLSSCALVLERMRLCGTFISVSSSSIEQQ